MASVEIVVVNYRTYDLLQALVNSYEEFPPKTDSHLTIIDVDSTEEFDSLSLPTSVSSVRSDWNMGYALACNYGAFTTDSDVICFLNADTRFVDDKCVDYCVNFLLEHDDVAIVGPLQYDSDGMCTHAGIMGSLHNHVDNGWRDTDIDKYRYDSKAVSVSGSAFFIKRSVWSAMTNCEIYRSLHPDVVGAFLPTQHYYEETALAYHVQAHGYEVWYLGNAEMIHEWHKSSPVGSSVDFYQGEAKAMFLEFCNAHGLGHANS